MTTEKRYRVRFYRVLTGETGYLREDLTKEEAEEFAGMVRDSPRSFMTNISVEAYQPTGGDS